MVFVTIYALFGDDLRLCLFRKGAADHVFSTLSTLACGCFFVEFWTRALLSVEYARLRLWFIPTGFYFWVDLLTASSLVLDVGWLWDGNRFAGMIGSSSALRVGRTLRSATRTARFVRVVRALRILSFASRWPVWCTSRLRGRQAAAIAPAAGGGGAAAAAAPARSDLSKRLSELTARRVVILVLLMLFGGDDLLPRVGRIVAVLLKWLCGVLFASCARGKNIVRSAEARISARISVRPTSRANPAVGVDGQCILVDETESSASAQSDAETAAATTSESDGDGDSFDDGAALPPTPRTLALELARRA
jgi:hypothetical protein